MLILHGSREVNVGFNFSFGVHFLGLYFSVSISEKGISGSTVGAKVDSGSGRAVIGITTGSKCTSASVSGTLESDPP